MPDLNFNLPHKYKNYWYPKQMLNQVIYFAKWQGFKATQTGDYTNYEDATCVFKTWGFRFTLECPQPAEDASLFCVWTLTGSLGMNARARFYANRIMLRGSVNKIPSFIAGGDVNTFVEDAFKQIIKMMSY